MNMRDLYKYLHEDSAPSTPSNTPGMGDPVVDDGAGKGTEPLPTAKAKKQKRKKKPEEE